MPYRRERCQLCGGGLVWGPMIRLTLAKLLEARKLTPYKLARLSGLSLSTVYRLANPDGRFQRLDSHTLNALCVALKVKPGDLLTYHPDR